MKKLLIATIAICAAAITQAASVTWSQYGLGAYGDADNEFAGAIYLMTGDADVASAFVSTVIGAGDGYATAYSVAIASAVTTMNYGVDYTADITGLVTTGSSYDFFVVALDTSNKGLFVSEVVTEPILTVGDTDIIFNADGSYEAPFTAGVTTYSGTTGGWYTAVPEPTSGLLMLIGMAGLALKRKRS
jgi:hypothetical protein